MHKDQARHQVAKAFQESEGYALWKAEVVNDMIEFAREQTVLLATRAEKADDWLLVKEYAARIRTLEDLVANTEFWFTRLKEAAETLLPPDEETKGADAA